MALIGTSYTPPGVYTQVNLNSTGATLTGNARVPVLIGEGTEFFTQSDIEIHRGSSATADDAVTENISDQVTGSTRTYQLTYFPVVSGNGSGTLTNDVSKITVTAAGIPVAVTSLNGSTGQFMTQTIIPQRTNVVVSYYFKRTDTHILNENASSQVPSFASLTVETNLVLSLSIPGALGNDVTLALTLAASGHTLGVADAQAVTGGGTNAISIELRKPDDTVRTLADLQNIINAGIDTTSGGLIVVTSITSGTTAGTALAAASFTGGAGQNTNTVFKTLFVPIVDGTNGGVVTTNPSDVQVKVNGVVASVSAVDGANGLITLQYAVPKAATVELTYFTNSYQDTSDILPAANVASIVEVGLGPDRSDYVEGTDFVLSGNSISWGAAATTAAGISTPGFTPLDATEIVTTLVDEKVYLQLCAGASSGLNSVFTLPDVPVDGSGLGRATDNIALVSVYIGTDPVSAAASGPVQVSRLSGDSATVTLFNPAPSGSNVYASYYRSTLNDHEFTITVDVAGQPGEGTYTVADELGAVAPSAKAGSATVTESSFATTGIVWPNNASDLEAALGGADETVTVTFQNDSLSTITTPAVQANLTVDDGSGVPRLVFRATTPGTAGNAVTISLVGGGTGVADASAISITSNAITVETLEADQTTTRSWANIVALFATYPPTIIGAGVILCTGYAGADLTPQASPLSATHLANGAAAITAPYADRFRVTTSRTSVQATADGLGLTGGATTPSGSNVSPGIGAVGYLGQTYIDATTGVKFTLVDPAKALSYGYTQLPSPSYNFQPGDTLTFTVSRETGLLTGATVLNLPGLRTKVVTTLGMNPGDTAVVSTFNRAGNSPAVGEYYYITFTTAKQASDMALKTFTKVDDAYAAYGQPTSINNRLALAIQLLTENGAVQFACVQVPVQTGLTQASDQSFIDAINSLAMPMTGGRKPDVIVPLSTSATVQQALGLFLTKQATPRQKAEAISFIGFDAFTSASAARATASSIANRRVIPVMPNSVGIMLQGPTDTVAVEVPLTGEFVAAALAGLNLNPANDVAQTLTTQKVVGFSRSLVQYDEPTKNLMATSGITVLDDVPGALEVRHYKTSDPSNPLTSEPTVTTISDFISKAFRKNFKQFTGRKMTPDLPSSIEATGNALLLGYMNSLITASAPVTATPDPADPATIAVTASYQPMFCALWINVTFTVNLSQ
jgi:hypothetical protein